jgi:hypothetical protein
VIGVEVDCDLGLIAAKPKAYVAYYSNRLLHCGFTIVFTFTFAMLLRLSWIPDVVLPVGVCVVVLALLVAMRLINACCERI